MDALLPCLGGGDSSRPRVTLPSAGGRLVGRARETRMTGAEFVSFTGIPYGKPPTGRLRFLRPQPVDPWPGSVRANKECSRPVQLADNAFGSRVIGTEDCLHLNVYTPDLPITENQGKLPVIVWLFGGEFVSGSATEEWEHPELLMDLGRAVVVTVSHRLGPFGFLSLGTSDVSGNQALWDQVLALRWVKENIAAFGGDPDRVTLAGRGAGAVCVGCHLASRHSAGLFHRAIMMSGAPTSPAYAPDKSPPVVGMAFAKHLGCARDSEDPTTVLAELQQKSASDLARASTFLGDWDCHSPRPPWLPDGADRQFFPDGDPVEAIANGKFNKMPLIVGYTREEGIHFTSAFLKDPSLWPKFDARWPKLVNMILLNRSADEFKEDTDGVLAEKIRSFYLDDNKIKKRSDDEKSEDAVFCQEREKQIVQMFGDAFVVGGVEYFSELIKSHSAQHLYRYVFDHPPTVSITAKMLKTAIGATKGRPRFLSSPSSDVPTHGSDHLFLMSSSLLPPSLSLPTQEDRTVAAITVRMVANFARGGNPTPNQDDPLLKKFVWEPDNGGKAAEQQESDGGGSLKRRRQWQQQQQQLQSNAELEKKRYLSITAKPRMEEFGIDLEQRSKFWIRVIDEVRKRGSSSRPPQIHGKMRADM